MYFAELESTENINSNPFTTISPDLNSKYECNHLNYLLSDFSNIWIWKILLF